MVEERAKIIAKRIPWKSPPQGFSYTRNGTMRGFRYKKDKHKGGKYGNDDTPIILYYQIYPIFLLTSSLSVRQIPFENKRLKPLL